MVIYKIENLINKKVYIGQTSDKGGNRARLAKHLYCLRKNKHQNNHLQSAYNKYGAKSFNYELIDSANTIEELNQLEVYWINYYNSMNQDFGYNLKTGGTNALLSEEIKERMRIAQNTPELLALRSKIHKGRVKSKEHIEKIRQSNLRTKNKQPIYLYDINGTKLDIFPSLQECIRITNVSETSVLHSINTGYPTCGFFFRRGDDLRKFLEKPKPIFYRSVIQYDLNNQYINTFPTIKDAALTLGLQKSAICNCCKGKLQKTGGYKFQYTNS